MHSDDTKLLEIKKHQKFDIAPSIIYADLECLTEKIDGNPESSSTAKVSKHISSGFSMSTISSFRSIENKYDNICEAKIVWKCFVNS